jgi:hypothetical protein
MRYDSFRIQNFKGIKDTTVQLQTIAGANVFAFVGLNESGKTTVLEAIHSFAPDEATSELLGGDLGVPFKERVPRHLLSEFTGDVSVAATLSVSAEDKKSIASALLVDHQMEIKLDEFPDKIVIDRTQRFENGDFKKNFFTLRNVFKVKSPKQKKWRDPTIEERASHRDAVFRKVPRIAYFPTFVFEFPKTIFLTERGRVVDKFYRRVFQDILDFDGRGQTVEKDKRLLGTTDLPLLPGLGAGTFGALAALHAGWNLNFLFLLDGDGQGIKERDRYAKEFGIALNRLVTLDEVVAGTKVIEDLLDDQAKKAIQKALGLGEKPGKAHIRRFFQERLASDKTEPLGPGFEARAKAALEGLRSRLSV